MSAIAAVFDVDRTLLPDISSEQLFLPYLLRRGKLGPRSVAYTPWFALPPPRPQQGRAHEAFRRRPRHRPEPLLWLRRPPHRRPAPRPIWPPGRRQPRRAPAPHRPGESVGD